MKNRLIIAAFFVPVVIFTVILAVMGVWPFGSRQIAVIDFYHQYLPLIEELQYKMQHGESLFYTWNGAGGCNFWNIIAYQAASPFNLLLILVPEKFLVEGLTAILIVRIGLAGSFMFYFLKKIYGRATIVTVGFSSLYALCAYVVAYYWNIMWMDAVMLLPLCILGLIRLIDGGRATLYTAVFAIIIFSNYYIGILMCVFILTYYFALYFGQKREGGFRAFALTSLRTALYSFLAIVMAGVMLLPTWISMKKSSAMKSDFPDYGIFYDDPLDILNQLLPLSKNSYMEGLPNIGCGLVVVILLAVYFINREIPLRSKITSAIYLGFIFLSLNINYLDYIWHGFHYPNMLPYRYAFAVSFILIRMAYESFCSINEVDMKHIWAVFAAIAAYYVLAQKLLEDVVDDMNRFFYFGGGMLILYVLLMAAWKKDLLNGKAFRYAFTILIVAEISCVSLVNVHMIGSTDKNTYNENSEDIAKAVKQVDDEFCRVEMDNAITLNEPARYHYKGITQFASSINSETNELYEEIGLEAEPGSNRCKYTLTDPVTNAMMNVKYIIARNSRMDDSDFTCLKKWGSTRLYENNYPLSIGYMLPDSIRTWDYSSGNPFENLNDYVRAATSGECGDVFREIEAEGAAAEDGTISATAQGRYTVASDDSAGAAKLKIEYMSEKTGKYYVIAECDEAEYITIKKENSKREIELDENYGSVVNVGNVKKGETFAVIVQYEAGKSGSTRCHVCDMDEELWDEAYKLISADTMEVSDYDETHLKGTIDADRSGVFVTSVPADEGWTIKVDGVERDVTDPVGGAWIALPLEKGKHTIEMTFRPPGIITGLVLSILGILILAVSHIWGDRISAAVRSRRQSAAPEEDEPVNDISDLF